MFTCFKSSIILSFLAHPFENLVHAKLEDGLLLALYRLHQSSLLKLLKLSNIIN